MEFCYHPEIMVHFPNLYGGVILARGLSNPLTGIELSQAFHLEQQMAKERIGDAPLSEIVPLVYWRQAFRSFGVDPTGYRSACEALLRRLTKKGDIPSINTLVDACNLISIRYALPVAAFDLSAIQGRITVCFANGTEQYRPLDSEDVEHPLPGEVIFVDEAGMVVARRWCWRQSAESAVNLDTRQAIFTIEAHHPQAQADVQAALDDLLDLLKKYAGGEFQVGLLHRNRLSLSWIPD
jgi:DNA/RNA-binding domain of Phe-tRNA-synthetase-like protein